MDMIDIYIYLDYHIKKLVKEVKPVGGIIAIYDSDMIYAIRLMEYIKKRKELRFDVFVFTEEESLLEFGMNRSIDILLIEDGLSITDEIKDKIKVTFILSDYINQPDVNGDIRVLKYQSAQILISDVLTNYNKLINKSDSNYGTNNTKIVSIISVTPERNKLGFAWSYAYNNSNHNKVLFIPLELLPNPFLDVNEPSISSLSDFLYYLKNKDPQLISIMNSYINYIDSVSYLSGISIGLDLLSITKEDISLWLEKMKAYTDYDLIIFYLAFYNEATVELIKESNEILIPIVEQSEDNQVVRELERQLNYIGVNMLSEKTHKIKIPLTMWSDHGTVSYQELKNSGSWKATVKFIEGDVV